MSFLINWDLLSDGKEADALRQFLNDRFKEIERPPFLGPLQVTEFDFGDVPPEVAIKDICDPSPEFYLPEDPDIWRPATPPTPPTIPGLSSGGLTASSSLNSFSTGVEHASAAGYGYHHASDAETAQSLFNGVTRQLRRRERMRGQESDEELSRLASARNLSVSGLDTIAEEGIRHAERSDYFSPNSNTAVASSSRVFAASHVPQFAYGTGWSGSVGLGLGLGLSSGTGSSYHKTASRHSPNHNLHRPLLHSAPASFSGSLASIASSNRYDYASDITVASEAPLPPRLTDHEVALQYADTMRRESDAQVELEVVYKGNMRLAMSTELIVNQPTPAFMVLPLTLTLTGFHFTATAIIAYLGDRVNFCFKEPDTGSAILHDISIDSEVGDRRKQVLKNVGRIERFIVEQLRKVIQDFLVLPNHQCLHLLHESSIYGDDELYEDSEPYDDEEPFDGI